MQKEMNLIIYQGKDGARVDLKSSDFETMWATQKQMSEIFDVEVPAISRHISNILNDCELSTSVISKMEITASDGKRYNVEHYNLDMIIAVGYRVNSAKATQFRIWATKILKEYIVKGFAMDDERLKDPSKNQYFKELLERVKEIRASEKLFYQQVKDIYATAIDYEEKKHSEEVQLFFKKTQNKLLHAITNKTAAELIIERHNVKDENFGCTNWSGSIVRKGDICIAKNYLTKKELKLLTSLVDQLLDHLEDQITNEKTMTLKDWELYTDELIEFKRYKLLKNAGSISSEDMKTRIDNDYKVFDDNRKNKEKEKAEKEALEDIKEIEKEVANILKKERKRNK
ncbi:MAG: hypothetical protein RL208_139 [Pseudomonadota bacterium]|jgi:hypothetical protein